MDKTPSNNKSKDQQQHTEPTLFEKIISRDIAADIIYEDEHCLAFKDINPQAPVHVLLIPKQHLDRLGNAQAEDAPWLGHMLSIIPKLSTQLGIADNFRVVINNGAGAGQSVFHLHMHILGGRAMTWPPG